MKKLLLLLLLVPLLSCSKDRDDESAYCYRCDAFGAANTLTTTGETDLICAEQTVTKQDIDNYVAGIRRLGGNCTIN